MKLDRFKRYATGILVDEHGNDVDINDRRYNADRKPLCTHDNNTCMNIAKDNGDGYGGFQPYCVKHYDTHIYRKYKKDYCENKDGRLGFECEKILPASHELAVDHINEIHDDHDPTNLQTLCNRCHPKKTHGIGKLIKAGAVTPDEAKDFFEVNKKLQRLRKQI